MYVNILCKNENIKKNLFFALLAQIWSRNLLLKQEIAKPSKMGKLAKKHEIAIAIK